MIILFLAVSLISAALIYPGWLWARKQGPRSPGVLLLPVFGVGLWFVLVMLHIGPQSLSNLIEIPVVAIAAVVIAYLKLFVMDKQLKKPVLGEAIAYVTVASVALGLRLFMPLLPE